MQWHFYFYRVQDTGRISDFPLTTPCTPPFILLPIPSRGGELPVAFLTAQINEWWLNTN
jgi:hypothetical protein